VSASITIRPVRRSTTRRCELLLAAAAHGKLSMVTSICRTAGPLFEIFSRRSPRSPATD
jgi:hypothetical protein